MLTLLIFIAAVWCVVNHYRINALTNQLNERSFKKTVKELQED